MAHSSGFADSGLGVVGSQEFLARRKDCLWPNRCGVHSRHFLFLAAVWLGVEKNVSEKVSNEELENYDIRFDSGGSLGLQNYGVKVGHVGQGDYIGLATAVAAAAFGASSKDNNVTGGTVRQ